MLQAKYSHYIKKDAKYYPPEIQQVSQPTEPKPEVRQAAPQPGNPFNLRFVI